MFFQIYQQSKKSHWDLKGDTDSSWRVLNICKVKQPDGDSSLTVKCITSSCIKSYQSEPSAALEGYLEHRIVCTDVSYRIASYALKSDDTSPMASCYSLENPSDLRDWKPSQTFISTRLISRTSPNVTLTNTALMNAALLPVSAVFFRTRDIFTVLFTLSKAGSP